MADQLHFGIAVGDLTKLSRDLRNVSKAISKGLTSDLKAAVQPVVDEAKSNASFSSKIPQTIKAASTSGHARVTIKVNAGGVRAPAAASFENGGRPGTFRHPVYGHRKVWVNQAAHPFLFPALTAKASSIENAVAAAVQKYLTEFGFD